MCLTRPRRRLRCRAITVSASASPMRISAFGPNAFSNRDSVDCEASAAPLHWVATDQQLVDRVLRQSRCVVAVLVTAGDAEHALAHQFMQAMLHLRLLATIAQATHQRIRQTQAFITRFEQQRTAVRAAVRLVKPRHHRFVEQVLEDYRLSCGIVQM